MSTLETRLRRLEAWYRPALPQVATCIMASSHESAADQIAQQIATGAHREGWPLLVITSPGFQDRRL
ncbi:hypothetical protein ASF58_20815 [Methylobacterium sp. Leaf125]|nr:hypothetical protein ASF58_20815 [Methylobacterium sp. Leaf125]